MLETEKWLTLNATVGIAFVLSAKQSYERCVQVSECVCVNVGVCENWPKMEAR